MLGVAVAAPLALTAACATLRPLPTLDGATPTATSTPTLPVTTARPPVMTAHGWAPERVEVRVDARLDALGGAAEVERVVATLDEIAGQPLVSGNAVRLLVDGPQTYGAMFEAIDAATDSINIESYIFDEAQNRGAPLTDRLIARAQAGVAVNVLYDGIGSMATPEAVLARLRQGGVQLCAFNPPNPAESRTGRLVQRTHRKMLIVDGRRGFTGGLNFSDEYRSSSFLIRRRGLETLDDGWRDTHLEVRGPAVAEMQQRFIASWAKQSCPGLAPADYLPPQVEQGTTVVRVVASSVDEDYGAVYLAKLAAVQHAVRSIDITMAYFAPDDRIEDALLGAAQRGVRVRLLVPGFSDFPGVLHAARAHYARLLAAGIEIYEYQTAFMHAKTMTVDGVWSTVGSANWDYKSFADNDELNVVIVDAEFGREMTALFERDLAAARRIDPAEWQSRPFTQRVVERFWVSLERLL
jgi:cardiolipin synthase